MRAALDEEDQLQRGRAQSSAERTVDWQRCVSDPWLQRGRAQSSAESDIRVSTPITLTTLQRGRAQSSAERQGPARQRDIPRQASTGPRSIERGEEVGCQYGPVIR